MKISVCISVCNGANFIERQLSSILAQSYLPDELVLVDDCSDDTSLEICARLIENTSISCLIIANEERRGVNGSFEKAIKATTGDIIVFSDQDDLWFNNRLQLVAEFFKNNPTANLLHLNAYIERDGKVLSQTVLDVYPPTYSIFKNIIHNRFTGCQIAIRRPMLALCLPFPDNSTCYYDHWISMVALMNRNVYFLNAPVGYYCRHEANLTGFERTRSIVATSFARLKLITKLIGHFLLRIDLVGKND